MADSRTRAWTFVVYPESVRPDWRELLDEMHIQWVESPLHDKDLNGNGEPKKPHIHVLLYFEGVKSYDQVFQITDALNCPIPQRAHDTKALVRYMAHLDNPDKAQYSTNDIVAHGGFDVQKALEPSSSQKHEYIAQMIDWCQTVDCIEYSDLLEYAVLHRPDDWYPLLCDSCTMLMTNYLRSRRHRVKRDLVDRITGEIVVSQENPTDTIKTTE